MEDIKTVLLVVNPISGAIEKTDLIEQVKKEVSNLKASLVIFETSGNDDCSKLEKQINELNPCRIAVAGGDGTIKLLAEALNGKKIPVGIIPAGSANGLATNLDLPDTMEGQIKVAFGKSLREMDVIVIDDEYCLHMSDFGLNAELIKNYENSNLRGKLGYLLQSIPTLVESEYPFQFTVEANNMSFETEGILLAIANARSYGTGATVNPRGRIDDGFFELLIFKNFDVIEILKTLRNEVDLDPDFVQTIITKEARISCATPVSFQIDGEYLGERTSIEVSIIPRCILIAAPQKI